MHSTCFRRTQRTESPVEKSPRSGKEHSATTSILSTSMGAKRPSKDPASSANTVIFLTPMATSCPPFDQAFLAITVTFLISMAIGCLPVDRGPTEIPELAAAASAALNYFGAKIRTIQSASDHCFGGAIH